MTKPYHRNLKQWILDEADGEVPEAVVIGTDDYGGPRDPLKHTARNVVLSWADAAPLLDYDQGWASPSSADPICVWTKNWVVFIRESRGPFLARLPRHPVDHAPVKFQE